MIEAAVAKPIRSELPPLLGWAVRLPSSYLNAKAVLVCQRHQEGGPSLGGLVKGACCALGKRFAAPQGCDRWLGGRGLRTCTRASARFR